MSRFIQNQSTSRYPNSSLCWLVSRYPSLYLGIRISICLYCVSQIPAQKFGDDRPRDATSFFFLPPVIIFVTHEICRSKCSSHILHCYKKNKTPSQARIECRLNIAIDIEWQNLGIAVLLLFNSKFTDRQYCRRKNFYSCNFFLASSCNEKGYEKIERTLRFIGSCMVLFASDQYIWITFRPGWICKATIFGI